MKRIHLFEFEDLSGFPQWIRNGLTAYIETLHKLIKTPDQLAPLIQQSLEHSKSNSIYDFCSGAGGPMLESFEKLKESNQNLKLYLSDLYPNETAIHRVSKVKGVHYKKEPVDVCQQNHPLGGLRTLICSFHHLKPKQAQKVLQSAINAKEPILIYEISDNSLPIWLWWISIPFTFLSTFFISLAVRPFTFNRFLFTYILPIYPLFIAWDGAVSNARTYTEKDLNELLSNCNIKEYNFEIGKIKGKMSSQIYLIGKPA